MCVARCERSSLVAAVIRPVFVALFAAVISTPVFTAFAFSPLVFAPFALPPSAVPIPAPVVPASIFPSAIVPTSISPSVIVPALYDWHVPYRCAEHDLHRRSLPPTLAPRYCAEEQAARNYQ